MRKIALALLLLMVITGLCMVAGCNEQAQHPNVPMAQNINFVGNTETMVYHFPTCPQKPAGYKSVYFDSPLAATRAGFHPCNYCNPPAPAAGP